MVARPIFASVDRGDWRRDTNALTEAAAMNPNPLTQIDIAKVLFAMAPMLRRPPERPAGGESA